MADVILWLGICFASAWWDAWFGIDHFNRLGIIFPYQPILGAILSVFWLGFWVAVFRNITAQSIGWLLVGLAIAGGGANLLRGIYTLITGIALNPANVEWWFGIHVPIAWMSAINVIVLVIGSALVVTKAIH